MPNEFRKDWVFQVFLLGAMLFFCLAITGAVRAYSPVPYGDMWNSYLDFFVKANSGDWSIWWAQHNEHRIVLARLLFWVDLAWFKGTGWFLLVANYLLLGLVCLVFWFALKESCPKPYWFIGWFLVIWLSSWSQSENLTWGFQSSFILAQLLPLSAFLMLHRTVANGKDGYKSFIAACFLGLLSLGSMANGVLALPLMTAYAMVVRLAWKRVLVLIILSCLGLWAYFYNYYSLGHHGTLRTALSENPVGLVRYVLLYVGSPFFHLMQGRENSLLVAQAAGALLVVSSVYFLWKSLRSISQSSLQLALLAFILYIGGTAFGTAGGRLIFGLEQALSSRYATPALMAWAALFVIIAPKVVRLVDPHRWKISVPLLALVLVLLPLQLGALLPQNGPVFQKSVAALALEMGIKDKEQIGVVFYSAEAALAISETAVANNTSVFGLPLFRNVREQIGGVSIAPDRVCKGHVDQIESLDDRNYVRVSGWFFDLERKVLPKSLWIVGSDGAVVGYALLGLPRPDVAAAIDPAAVNSGFKGYVLSNTQGLAVSIFNTESNCTISAKLPMNIYRVFGGMKPDQVTVSSNSVLPGNKWVGSDYQQSDLDDLTVLGSFVQSDFDTGAISLRLKRGDRVFYRSGPTSGRQFLSLNDVESSKTALPVSLDWQILEFSNPVLPNEFVITLSDEGDGWGEWSAIALQKQGSRK